MRWVRRLGGWMFIDQVLPHEPPLCGYNLPKRQPSKVFGVKQNQTGIGNLEFDREGAPPSTSSSSLFCCCSLSIGLTSSPSTYYTGAMAACLITKWLRGLGGVEGALGD